MPNDGRTLHDQVRDAFYSDTPESELELARLSKEAMETMNDEQWDALCIELLGEQGEGTYA